MKNISYSNKKGLILMSSAFWTNCYVYWSALHCYFANRKDTRTSSFEVILYSIKTRNISNTAFKPPLS